MGYMEVYESWLNDPYFDEETKRELRAISDNTSEIEDRFYKELEFGTGGLRGVIGAGTNRMNVYTVRKASQGLANFILAQGTKDKGIAITMVNVTGTVLMIILPAMASFLYQGR